LANAFWRLAAPPFRGTPQHAPPRLRSDQAHFPMPSVSSLVAPSSHQPFDRVNDAPEILGWVLDNTSSCQNLRPLDFPRCSLLKPVEPDTSPRLVDSCRTFAPPRFSRRLRRPLAFPFSHSPKLSSSCPRSILHFPFNQNSLCHDFPVSLPPPLAQFTSSEVLQKPVCGAASQP